MYRVGVGVIVSVVVAAAFVLHAPPSAADEGWHSRWIAQSDYLTMQPGQTTTFWIKFRNTGTQTWTRGVWGQQVNLALNGDNKEPFRLGMACNWLWDDRIATTAEATVRPGEVGLFNFCVRAPTVAGTYYLNLRPVVDGTTWLEDEGVFWVIVVAPRRIVSLVEVGGAVDASRTGGNYYGYAALVRNESLTEAVTSVNVTFTLYDAAGTVLATESASVSYLAPQEFSGVGGYAILSNGRALQVTRVSAVVGSYSWAWRASTGSGAMAFTGSAFLQDTYSWKATATMRNPLRETLSYLTVYAVGRDAAGRIVGGGAASASIVPAAASLGAEATYHGNRPASVVLYATAMPSASVALTPNRTVSIVEVGGARDESGRLFSSGYGYGALVRNGSSTESVRSVTVSFTFSDDAGTVLGTASDAIDVLAPQEVSGVAGSALGLSSELAARVTRVAALVGATDRSWFASTASGAFAFAGDALLTETYSVEATATMRSPHLEAFSYVTVYVVGRDAAGRIVGGGSTSASAVPAGASLGVVASYYGRRPQTLTFYATATNRSRF